MRMSSAHRIGDEANLAPSTNVANDTSMHSDRDTMGATRDASSIEPDRNPNTTAERLAQRLEDAVERSMNDLESERPPLKGLRSDVQIEGSIERVTSARS